MSDPKGEWGVGVAFFAGCVLIMMGIFDMIQGFAALFKKDFFAVTPNYVFHFDSSTWGWIHLLLGLILLLAGFAVFRGAVWGRIVGVVVAIVAAVANFAFIPIYPIWSIIVIASSIAVIWALTAHGRDMVIE